MPKAYRGTVDWIGEDGAANVTNTVGLTKLRQMVADEDTTKVNNRDRTSRGTTRLTRRVLRARDVSAPVARGTCGLCGDRSHIWSTVPARYFKRTP